MVPVLAICVFLAGLLVGIRYGKDSLLLAMGILGLFYMLSMSWVQQEHRTTTQQEAP